MKKLLYDSELMFRWEIFKFWNWQEKNHYIWLYIISRNRDTSLSPNNFSFKSLQVLALFTFEKI